jgi:hypothetical protein
LAKAGAIFCRLPFFAVLFPGADGAPETGPLTFGALLHDFVFTFLPTRLK